MRAERTCRIAALVFLGMASIFSLTSAAGASISAARSYASRPKWRIAHSPSFPGFGQFTAVAVINRSDVWAVGGRSSGELVEHWNGRRWSVEKIVNLDRNGSNQLMGVAGDSSRDVWAVGDAVMGCALHPVAQRWNGRIWENFRLPRLDESGYLYGVAVLGRSDVWVSGIETKGLLECDGPIPRRPTVSQYSHPLVEHWNGRYWRVVTVPFPRHVDASLTSLSALSPNDVWAAGNLEKGSSNHPLVEHWNGRLWSTVSLPGQTQPHRTLSAIVAVSPRDVWTVGYYWPHGHGRQWGSKILVERWNGSRWSIVEAAQTSCHESTLGSIAMTSPHDGWAAGEADHCGKSASSRSLIERWNGRRWSLAATPLPRAWGSYLSSISGSAGQAWAVGGGTRPGNTTGYPLIERFR